MALLEIENLHVQFQTAAGVLRAVQDVSFSVGAGEVVALVGESGCGKSVTSKSILRLNDGPNARAAGRILFDGRDINAMTLPELRALRGNRIGMIFQEPMTSLTPVLTVGEQIAEPLRLHRGLGRREALDQAIELLKAVGIPAPERRIDNYPHELSGGMCQRVMIAMALACQPELLIADEPTTALDVTIQAQILELLDRVRREFRTAILLITHDLAVVAESADRVVVMYAGRVVEQAPVRELFHRPCHPYTRGLMGAMPHLGSSLRPDAPDRLNEIPGTVPALTRTIAGCAFASRCDRATGLCHAVAPERHDLAGGHSVLCHHIDRETRYAS